MTDYRYNNDLWTLEDTLGIARTGDQVARLALEVPTPFTLGIIGKWGAGKTSILRRAFVTLGGKPLSQAVPLGENKSEYPAENAWEEWRYENRLSVDPYPLDWHTSLAAIAKSSFCVWYSPWQHQSAENPLLPLLLEIHAQYGAKENLKRINRHGGMAALTLIKDVALAGANLLGKPALVSGVVNTFKAVNKSWQEATGADLTKLSDGQRFHLLFEDAIETLLDTLAGQEQLNKDARLIIFVDDLDRCEEDVVINLLESIKLYLSSRRCVFILGIDDGAVLRALQHHWKERSEDDNREYLEKLFQATLPIPVPEVTDIRRFIECQLLEHQFPDAAHIAENIAHLLEPNPRKVKNFINSLCATWALFEGHASQEDAHRFVLFRYLSLYHKSIWRLLERQPWSLRVFTKVITGADASAALPSDINDIEQKMLQEIFSRAFAHVLGPFADEEANKHRRLPLDEAVKLFNERIDRKRSDEYFIYWYSQYVALDWDLPDTFLHLSAKL